MIMRRLDCVGRSCGCRCRRVAGRARANPSGRNSSLPLWAAAPPHIGRSVQQRRRPSVGPHASPCATLRVNGGHQGNCAEFGTKRLTEPAAANCSSDRPTHNVIERPPAFPRIGTDACRASLRFFASRGLRVQVPLAPPLVTGRPPPWIALDGRLRRPQLEERQAAQESREVSRLSSAAAERHHQRRRRRRGAQDRRCRLSRWQRQRVPLGQGREG